MLAGRPSAEGMCLLRLLRQRMPTELRAVWPGMATWHGCLHAATFCKTWLPLDEKFATCIPLLIVHLQFNGILMVG